MIQITGTSGDKLLVRRNYIIIYAFKHKNRETIPALINRKKQARRSFWAVCCVKLRNQQEEEEKSLHKVRRRRRSRRSSIIQTYFLNDLKSFTSVFGSLCQRCSTSVPIKPQQAPFIHHCLFTTHLKEFIPSGTVQYLFDFLQTYWWDVSCQPRVYVLEEKFTERWEFAHLSADGTSGEVSHSVKHLRSFGAKQRSSKQ